ncbi:Uncharacterised protein [Mycobacteroides abscessus subsp. abscessus]|nr:Uncharacterised protein [Mycobacteroides abscessus subsp. abscessus]
MRSKEYAKNDGRSSAEQGLTNVRTPPSRAPRTPTSIIAEPAR